MRFLKNTFRITILIIFIFGARAFSQGFITPVGSISGNASVVTNDGKLINGKIRSASFGTRGISRIGFTVTMELNMFLNQMGLKV
jgi:hypothetical protein